MIQFTQTLNSSHTLCTVDTLFTSYNTVHFGIVYAHIGTVHTLFTSYDSL